MQTLKVNNMSLSEDRVDANVLEKSLKDKSKVKLSEKEINTVLANIVNRKRFIYNIKDIVLYILKCLCLRNLKFKRY